MQVQVKLLVNWSNICGTIEEYGHVVEFKAYFLDRVKNAYPEYSFRIIDVMNKEVDYIKSKTTFVNLGGDFKSSPGEVENVIRLVQLIVDYDFSSWWCEYLKEIDEIEKDLNSLAKKDKRVKLVKLNGNVE